MGWGACEASRSVREAGIENKVSGIGFHMQVKIKDWGSRYLYCHCQSEGQG